VNQKYTADFYDAIERGSYQSALAILGELFRLYVPDRVVDVGCGRAAWLAAAEQLGSRTLKGIDGDWISPSDLLSESIVFEQQDLSKPIRVDAKFDLCICVEVAEHLESGDGGKLLDSLCELSDLIVFSAAIPGQGGVDHVNEQWQSYWITEFATRGFAYYDLFRPRFWDDDAVEWWYRQNIFLFSRGEPAFLSAIPKGRLDTDITDIIHPENVASKKKWERDRLIRLREDLKSSRAFEDSLELLSDYLRPRDRVLADLIRELRQQ